MRRIDEIIVHCTASPEGRHVTVKDVDNWHRTRGWSGIGYHYLIYLDGSVHKGRPIERQGAHCATGGHNRHSIGVCYVGGCAKDGKTPKDTRTPEQKEALRQLLKDLLRQFPNATIHGHREFVCKRIQKGVCSCCAECPHNKAICLLADKACPSFAVSEYADLQPKNDKTVQK